MGFQNKTPRTQVLLRSQIHVVAVYLQKGGAVTIGDHLPLLNFLLLSARSIPLLLS